VCREEETCGAVAARLSTQGERGEVVVALDIDGMACGWATRGALQAAPAAAPVKAVLEERIPEVPPDIPAAAAAALLRDQGAEYGFLMHNWPGEPRPAAVVRRSALEARLAEAS
jgi:hypothetical protein